MAEMRTIPCPSCDWANQPLVAMDGIEEYRCHSCGLVYYGPCGCDTVYETVDEAKTAAAEDTLSADWQTTVPPVEAQGWSSEAQHPGCS
jgi:hypothetical protein